MRTASVGEIDEGQPEGRGNGGLFGARPRRSVVCLQGSALLEPFVPWSSSNQGMQVFRPHSLCAEPYPVRERPLHLRSDPSTCQLRLSWELDSTSDQRFVQHGSWVVRF